MVRIPLRESAENSCCGEGRKGLGEGEKAGGNYIGIYIERVLPAVLSAKLTFKRENVRSNQGLFLDCSKHFLEACDA